MQDPRLGKATPARMGVLANALPSDKVARLAQVEDLTIGAEPERLRSRKLSKLTEAVGL